MEQPQQPQEDEAVQARAAAQAVLRAADQRESQQKSASPLKSFNARLSVTKQQIQNEITAELGELKSDFTSTKQSLNARFSVTKQQIQNEIQAELGEWNKDFHSTKEQIGNAIDMARKSLRLRTTTTSTTSVPSNKTTSTTTNGNKPSSSRPDENILADLITLEMKITLCGLMISDREMQREDNDDYDSDDNTTPEEDNEETLLDIIGYLEACVPRMDDLIEAGMEGGILQAETVQVCLVTRERLELMLERCDSPYAAATSTATTTSTETNEPSSLKPVPVCLL
jgi:hypothetical protein